MTSIDDYIAEARGVDLETVFGLVKGVLGRKSAGGDYAGPCPAPGCGGRDRFRINFAKGLWFCRQCDGGKGGGTFDLVAQVHGFDLRSRSGLLGTAEEILGRAPPDISERESDDERAIRRKALDDRARAAEAARAAQEKQGNRQREFAINQGRGFWLNARDAAGTVVETYLQRRTGARTIADGVWENLRFAPRHPYLHGKDGRGHDIEIHCGPAMIAPMIDLEGHVTGCHRTWIDLDAGPKLRPVIHALTAEGVREDMVTKKMRGHKKGSIIPICGDPEAKRWLGGEGIETTMAIAGPIEHWRSDTFYFAAGDLGNMAGPADAKSNFAHPSERKADVKGVLRPVMIAGPVPKPGSEGDCFQLPPHVAELVLLADGDSSHWFTVSAMARAEARLSRDGLDIAVWWPPEGTDFAAIAVAAEQRENAP
ncbi:MAG: hypothetical protein JWR80_7991 [Bradyrhizobium sp.]|nr:hypothetical protein [Bradyrhizobium sp.]